MIDITLENFETDLIQGSTQLPILLDIWAPWCGPCKALGPLLEKLETSYAGRFQLAKLNADEEQEIAGQLSQMFGVRSIPFCVMFVGGQPVDGFVGALPEAQIREFLDKHVPPAGEGEAEAGLQDEQAVPEADAEGVPLSPLDQMQDALAREPGNDELRFALIKFLLADGKPDAAAAIYEPVASRGTGLLAEPRVTAFGRYVEAARSAPGTRPAAQLDEAIAANKRDFAARFELAQQHFAAGHFTQAMDELLEIIMRDKAWSDELARKTYVAILEVMTKPVVKAPAGKPAAGGADTKSKLEIAGKHEVTSADPVIDQYRRKLSMALF